MSSMSLTTHTPSFTSNSRVASSPRSSLAMNSSSGSSMSMASSGSSSASVLPNSQLEYFHLTPTQALSQSDRANSQAGQVENYAFVPDENEQGIFHNDRIQFVTTHPTNLIPSLKVFKLEENLFKIHLEFLDQNSYVNFIHHLNSQFGLIEFEDHKFVINLESSHFTKQALLKIDSFLQPHGLGNNVQTLILDKFQINLNEN